MKKEFKKRAEWKLEKEAKKLKRDLERIADRGVELEENWEARYPDIGFEGSEDMLEDRAKARAIYEGRKGIEQVLEKKLQKVNQARQRIGEGTYGACRKCEREISKKRLEVLPEAALCKECLLEKRK